MSQNILGLKWVDKYIPLTVDDLIMNSISKDKLKRLLDSKTRFNLTLHGRPGIGKTATCNVIVKELNAIEYFVPCGVSGNIDNIRTNVQAFCESISYDDRPKIVILDESDSISMEGQKALRNIISEHKDTSFLLTANYLNRIIEPLQSRCQPVSLTFNALDVMPRLVEIMEAEEVKYDNDSKDIFLKKVLPKFLPDIRSSVSVLQDCCSDGTLNPETEVELVNGLDTSSKNILKELKAGKSPTQIREYLIQHEEEFSGDYLKLSSSVFNMLCKTNINSKSLSTIGDIIYRIDQVIDKEIQFFVLVCYLNELINGNK